MGLILTIVIVGFIVWALITYVPMPQPFQGLVILAAILMLAVMLFGSGSSLPAIHLPR